jgi:adenosylcobinamide-GDP ribazoletransferase
MSGLNARVVSILSVAVMALVTGALHEDGLADTVDGFWGGHSRERKLEIMRDSSIGAYGVLALLLTVLLRIVLLSLLIESLGGANTSLVLLACASLSRAAMLQPWTILPAARSSTDAAAGSDFKQESGLSARYGAPNRKTLAGGIVASLPALALLVWTCGLGSSAVALVIYQSATVLVTLLSRHHIQGHSGDTLGATQQLSELGLLLGLVWTM